MLFNSYKFFIFFPLVCFIYFILPKKIKNIWLLITSYMFYMLFDIKSVVVLIACTIITYVSGLIIGNGKETNKSAKKQVLVTSISILIMILVLFKYLEFLVGNLNAILGTDNLNWSLNILMPVGLSFITLQAIGYIIDVYRGDIKGEKNFIKFALFISYFPRVISGPIERAKNFLPQLDSPKGFDHKRIKDGLIIFLWGLFEKIVIADRAALVVNKVFNNYTTYGGIYIFVALVLCAFRTYADFSGYSLMAMGASKILGYDLIENFRSPYFSKSIGEFWKRWHISLSSWLKDYIYIPLGGSRKGKLRKYVNILIVFLVSGLWHGANWSCVIWGLLYGVYQIFGDVTKGIRNTVKIKLGIKNDTTSHSVLQTLITFMLVAVTSVFLETGGVLKSIDVLKNMIGTYNPWVIFDGSITSKIGLASHSFWLLVISIIVMLLVDYAKYKGCDVKEWISKQDLWFRWTLYIVLVVSILVFGVWGPNYDASAFVYMVY